MPTDSALLVAGQGGAPLDYRVPDAQEIITLSARAVVNGSGAATAFLPVVQLVSDAGIILAEAITDATVAAGGSAQVSWFPRVGAAASGASTSGGSEWFFASRQTNFTVATNNPQRRIPWTHFVTSDATVFSVTSGLAANDTVNGLKAGIYTAFGQLVWASPQTYPHSCLIITDFFGVSGAAQTPTSDSTTDTTAVGQVYNVHDSMLAITNAVPGEISLTAKNWDVANHVVASAFYAISYQPNSTLVT